MGGYDGCDNRDWALWEDEHVEPVACNNFHPYNSNPQLCHCGRPVFEHEKHMERLNKLKRLTPEEYEDKRERLLELAGTDAPDADPVVEIGGGFKMRSSEYEQLRKFVMESLKSK
jgi:heterodisulfide reductase subunit B